MIHAQDINGNTATNFNGPVVVTVVSHPTGGTITGVLSGTMVNGTLVLRNLTTNVAGTYLLKIASGNLSTLVTLVGRGRRS